MPLETAAKLRFKSTPSAVFTSPSLKQKQIMGRQVEKTSEEYV